MAEAGPLVRRKRKHHSHPSNERSWETETSESGKRGASKGAIFTWLFLFSILLGVAGVLFFQEKNKRFKTFENRDRDSSLSEGDPSTDSLPENVFFDFAGASKKSTNKPLLELQTADLDTAREATKAFFDCKTIEEFPPLIRDPERVMPLVREYYRTNPYQPGSARTFKGQGTAQVAKKFASFSVVLRDYSTRAIALELTENGALVDWESWVGYCAIPWETFIEKKVTEPTVVRVRLVRANYFNFNFRDDREWACFRLATSTDSSVVYGYAPLDADFLRELPGPGDAEVTAILKVSYPDPAIASNQVIITDFLQSGWVLGL